MPGEQPLPLTGAGSGLLPSRPLAPEKAAACSSSRTAAAQRGEEGLGLKLSRLPVSHAQSMASAAQTQGKADRRNLRRDPRVCSSFCNNRTFPAQLGRGRGRRRAGGSLQRQNGCRLCRGRLALSLWQSYVPEVSRRVCGHSVRTAAYRATGTRKQQ